MQFFNFRAVIMVSGLTVGMLLLALSPILPAVLNATPTVLIVSALIAASGAILVGASFATLLRRASRWIISRVRTDTARSIGEALRVYERTDVASRTRELERFIKKEGSTADILRRLTGVERRVMAAVDTSVLDSHDTIIALTEPGFVMGCENCSAHLRRLRSRNADGLLAED